MITGRGQTQGCARPAVGLIGCIHLSAAPQERSRNLNDVFWGLLPKIFYSIRGHIMDEWRLVRSRGPRMDQFRVLSEQAYQAGQISADSTIGRQFEPRNR